MAKHGKGKKNNQSSGRTMKNINTEKKTNPFEVHINRQKHSVIGRKLKNDKGLPGVSRAKALKKRKATLLQEYKYKNKTNRFVDRRIGEKNSAMTNEDRVVARFAAEQAKGRRKTIFNLGDDEILTHKGQTLSEIEKFDDPRSDDDDEEAGGKLEASFVGDAHFGGGILRNREDNEDAYQSRQNLIQQLIVESKKRKAEKQKESEKAVALTEKLDAEWKELQSIVLRGKAGANKSETTETSVKMDPYDKAVHEMKFESRGKPSDRLKSEEEVAQEEKKKLEALEMERVKRMHGNLDKDIVRKHQSADDLDDGFQLEDIEENENEDDLDVNNSMMAEPDDGKDDESASEMDDIEGEEESEDGSDSKSDIGDLRYYSDSEQEEEEKTRKDEEKTVTSVVPESRKIDFAALKEEMENARKELPFTFDVPDTYEKLQELFEGHGIVKQCVILERIMKCNHPSLKAGNRERLGQLFAFLLQWLHDKVQDVPYGTTDFNLGTDPNAELTRGVFPLMFDLAQICGAENCSQTLSKVLAEKYDQWLNSESKHFPGFETLVFLQLVPWLFPASDFRHPVVTPAVIMMANMLHVCQPHNLRDLCTGLFICSLVLQYTQDSHRFLPESVNFLIKVVSTGIQYTKEDHYSRDSCEAEDLDPKDGNYQIALETALTQLTEVTTRLQNTIPSWSSIISPVIQIMKEAESSIRTVYPKSICEKMRRLISLYNPVKLEKLVMQKKRPRPLKMFEPAIERITEGKRKGPMSDKKRESLKLKHKYKREMKGAIREIRRDRSFIANIKLKETMRSDAERKEKVKDLMSSLALQAGEVNKLDRSKKKKK